MALLLLASSLCFAAEGGIGAYIPGYRNFLTGTLPPQEGVYLRNDFIFYSSSAPRVVLNGLPVENISVDVAADIVDLSYVFPRKLFGGTYAVAVTQPFVWAKLSGRIIGTDIEPSDDRFALGDTVISPLFVGWSKGKLHYNVNLPVFIPTESYDIHRVVNTGRNYWTIDPQLGVTYFNPRTGWDISASLGYSINSENRATQYKSGDVLHFDYAVGRAFKNGLKAGVAGYTWTQVTSDSGSGALFGPFKSRVFGIGPVVQWKTGAGELRFRYLHEFGAKNHLEGDQAALSFRKRL